MQDLENYLKIESARDLVEFVDANFSTGEKTNGISHEGRILLRNLMAYEYRMTKPYLTFLARILLLAAEYGYPQISWLVGGFGNIFNVDLFDPRYLLWTAYYLSDINKKLWSQKIQFLHNVPSTSFKDKFNATAIPSRGKVEFNDSSKDLRTKEGLPHYLPDIEFINAMSDFKIFIDKLLPAATNPDFDNRRAFYFNDVANSSPEQYLEKYGPFLRSTFPTIDIDALLGADFQNEVKLKFK